MGNGGNCRCSGTHCDGMVRHSGSLGRGSAETARHSFVNGIG